MNPIHYGGNPEVIYPQYRTSCWNRSPMKPFLLGLLFCTPSEGPGVKCHPGIHTGLWLVYTLWLTPALSILHYQTLTELLPALNILIFFRAAAQMQPSWLIRNFDQYEFLHPPPNTWLSGIFYHFSRKRLPKVFHEVRYIPNNTTINRSQIFGTVDSAQTKLQNDDRKRLIYFKGMTPRFFFFNCD